MRRPRPRSRSRSKSRSKSRGRASPRARPGGSGRDDEVDDATGLRVGQRLNDDRAAGRRLAHALAEHLQDWMDWNSHDAESVFRSFDTNSDGILTPAEFKRGLRKTGKGLSEEQLAAAIRAIDRNGEYEIDFPEFVKVFRRANASRWLAKRVSAEVRKKIRIYQQNIEDAFLGFDTNGDGVLSRRELQKGLQTLDIHLSTKDMKRLMEVIDADGDDRIDWKEFLAVASRPDSNASRRPSPKPQTRRRAGSRSTTRLSASERRAAPAPIDPELSWTGRSQRAVATSRDARLVDMQRADERFLINSSVHSVARDGRSSNSSARRRRDELTDENVSPIRQVIDSRVGSPWSGGSRPGRTPGSPSRMDFEDSRKSLERDFDRHDSPPARAVSPEPQMADFYDSPQHQQDPTEDPRGERTECHRQATGAWEPVVVVRRNGNGTVDIKLDTGADANGVSEQRIRTSQHSDRGRHERQATAREHVVGIPEQRQPQPEPEPEPEALSEPELEEEPFGLNNTSRLNGTSFYATGNDPSNRSFRNYPELPSLIVEDHELEQMDLDELASEVAAMREMVQEVRESRAKAVERAARHLALGRSLVETEPPRITEAMQEYAEGLRLVDDASAGEIKQALTLHGVEWETEYTRNYAAALSPALNSGKVNVALEMIQKKARENGLCCGWRGTSPEERDLAEKLGAAREQAAWMQRSGRHKSGDGKGLLSARAQVQQHYDLGMAHFEEDRYIEAHAFFDEALDMKLNDKGLARKIGKALTEAKNAMEQQEQNRQKAEAHRIEGRKYHERARIEQRHETVKQLWCKAIREYEKGLVIARQRFTAQPSLVIALEKDLDDAKRHKGLQVRPSLRTVASKIVGRTKQGAVDKIHASRRLLGEDDFEAAEEQLNLALKALGGHANGYVSPKPRGGSPKPKPKPKPKAGGVVTETPGHRGGRGGGKAAKRRVVEDLESDDSDDTDVSVIEVREEYTSSDFDSEEDDDTDADSDSDESDESDDDGDDDESESESGSDSDSDSGDDDDSEDDEDEDESTDDDDAAKAKRRRRAARDGTSDSVSPHMLTAGGVLALAVMIVGVKVAW